jgi:flagellar hook-length control protein FliK
VPHVASDFKPHALKAMQPHALARPAPDRAQASPFESLLDDSAPPPAPPRPADNDNASRAERPEPATRAKDSAKAGDDTKPVGKSADTSDKPKTTEKAPGDAEVATDDKAAAAQTAGLVAGTDEVKTAGDGKPAVDSNPADAQTVDAATPTLATLTPADALAAAIAPVAEAAQAAAPAEHAALVLTATVAKTGKDTAPQADADELADSPKDGSPQLAESKFAAKTVAPSATEAKPQGDAEKKGDGDKNAVAHARGEGAGKENRAAAIDAPNTIAADSNAAAPKVTADAGAMSALSAPSHAGPSTAAATPAAANTLPPPAAAIPLAGVAIEIAGKALQGTNHFEIRLDPPELGRIEVHLAVDRDGNITSRMIADRPDTLDLLRRDAAGLERALQDAGLKTSDNGLQFSLRDQTGGQRQAEGGADMARLVAQDETLGAAEILQSGYSRLAGQGSGIDIHV